MRDVVCAYLDALDGPPRSTRSTDFSGPFPVEVICSMLGVPVADRQRIRHQVDLMLHREPGDTATEPRGDGRRDSSSAPICTNWSSTKRANPSDDLLSQLCTVEAVRDDGETRASTTSR